MDFIDLFYNLYYVQLPSDILNNLLVECKVFLLIYCFFLDPVGPSQTEKPVSFTFQLAATIHILYLYL